MPLEQWLLFKKAGTYYRRVDGKCIQRFACKTCKRTFSTQTFSTTYWLKKPTLIKDVFHKTTGGMSNRQVAKDLKVEPSTVDRIISRMARHSLLFHIRMLQLGKSPSEIAVDGFETFEFSQYYPFHHHTAVEKDTDFFIYFTDSELRRKGRMTKAQKQKREMLEKQHGRPDPKAIQKDMKHLLEVTLKDQLSATVYSDAHQSYKAPIRQVNCEITHVVTPGKAHRDSRNNLWEINLLDLLIRHYGANHKRETIAWSKRRQSSSERLVIFLIWRNYMKGRREKERSSPTPAMERGMLDHRLTVEEVFGERIFRDHIELPERWAEYYDRKVRSRALPKNKEHDLKYAR